MILFQNLKLGTGARLKGKISYSGRSSFIGTTTQRAGFFRQIVIDRVQVHMLQNLEGAGDC